MVPSDIEFAGLGCGTSDTSSAISPSIFYNLPTQRVSHTLQKFFNFISHMDFWNSTEYYTFAKIKRNTFS